MPVTTLEPMLLDIPFSPMQLCGHVLGETYVVVGRLVGVR